jgi:hypothetical protein
LAVEGKGAVETSIERSDLFGGDERIALRDQRDERAESNPLCRARRRRQREERIVAYANSFG